MISIYVLIVAIGARQAARAAQLRAQRHSAAEDLEAARSKVQEVGHFLSTNNWEVVRIRSEEISNTCQTLLGKMDDDALRRKIRNRLLVVAEIMGTLANRAADAQALPLSPSEKSNATATQLKAGQLLSAILGESRSLLEKE